MGGRTVEIKFCMFTIEKVEKKRWMDKWWKANFVCFLKKTLKKKMGGRTVEIEIYIFTIEKGEKKMGKRTVDIKISIFIIEKGEKRWVDKWWKSKSKRRKKDG